VNKTLAALLALALLGGCTKVGTGSPDASTSGAATSADSANRHAYTVPHVLRYSSAEDPQGLNTLTAGQAIVMYMATMTGAWLVKTDARGEPSVPELITEIPTPANGGVSKDGKTITYHLRKGVKWSDGAPFDADDVVFSTNEINNPANNVPSRDGWELIKKIDEPDKYTVVYHLSKPYSSYLVTFFSTGGANPFILPKHLLKDYKELNDVPYNSAPVGIGPFKYEEWKRGDSVVMVPNPLYWRGTPKLQKIIFKIIPDRNTVVEQMRTHELDLWTPVAPHFVPELRKIPGVQILTTPSFTFDHLDFNMSHPVFKDLAVREALRYAIDRKTLNEKIRFGQYIVEESVVPPASAMYHIDLPLVPFDIAKANQILDAAGWKRGPDGIRAKNGVRLSIDYASSSGAPDIDLQVELIRRWWGQLGVEFTVKRYLSSLLFAPAEQGGIIYSGKFDAVNFGWGGDPNQDLSNLYACYRFPPNGQNVLRYCNEAATAAMDRAKTNYERVGRKPDIAFVQRQIYHDVPTIVLDARREIYAYNADLKNWHPNPIAPFDDMLNVDI
jgi:peptide/nickel transport system substrate-binding protein